MKYARIAGILSASFLVGSCSSMRPTTQEIPVPPERIVQKGYSFVPLNEKGWAVTARNESDVTLGKRGENPDETIVIAANVIAIAPFKTKSQDQFVRWFKENAARVHQDPRFNVIHDDVTFAHEKGTNCVESRSVIEDNATAKRSNTPGIMILQYLALACAHPTNKSVVVMLVYSHRYYPEYKDSAFQEKATTVLNSLEFTDR
ncbi:MAG TPA: hypothetical protein VEG25_08195 [Burkholderiales bacterium]|nr:hypothetical protein [Burkholderiales bacterium]